MKLQGAFLLQKNVCIPQPYHDNVHQFHQDCSHNFIHVQYDLSSLYKHYLVHSPHQKLVREPCDALHNNHLRKKTIRTIYEKDTITICEKDNDHYNVENIINFLSA